MGLDRLVRNAVALSKRLTKDLQVPVTHRRATASASDGAITLGPPTTRLAIVEARQQRIVGRDGVERLSKAKITLLEPITVGLLDEFILPDESTGPILSISGMADPKGGAYLTEVWL